MTSTSVGEGVKVTPFMDGLNRNGLTFHNLLIEFPVPTKPVTEVKRYNK